MTLARRLSAIETSLSPTQRVLAWLDEAHAFGSLEAYVESLLDQPSESFPINRLAHGAARATRVELARKPADVVDAAVRKVLRATLFRFDLVMRINVTSHEMIDREALIHVALAGQLAMLANEDRADSRAEPSHAPRLAICRDVTAGRVMELLAVQDARASVESRYLDGRAALFPAGLAAWSDRVEEAKVLAVMADRLSELDGLAPATSMDPDAYAARTFVRADDLIEPARTTALEKLDEGRQALSIATAWLRAKARLRPGDSSEAPTL